MLTCKLGHEPKTVVLSSDTITKVKVCTVEDNGYPAILAEQTIYPDSQIGYKLNAYRTAFDNGTVLIEVLLQGEEITIKPAVKSVYM